MLSSPATAATIAAALCCYYLRFLSSLPPPLPIATAVAPCRYRPHSLSRRGRCSLSRRDVSLCLAVAVASCLAAVVASCLAAAVASCPTTAITPFFTTAVTPCLAFAASRRLAVAATPCHRRRRSTLSPPSLHPFAAAAPCCHCRRSLWLLLPLPITTVVSSVTPAWAHNAAPPTVTIVVQLPPPHQRIVQCALFLHCCPLLQYATWKEECRRMFPIVGSGRYITAPVITEAGLPIQDPLVLLEANPDKGLISSYHGDNSIDTPSFNEPEECSHSLLDEREIQWKLTLHQIGLDVVRTDRTLVFYEKQENLSKLWDILAVYAWIDKDVGYCQGMSDLCSPMIMLLENEADAFWCFERLMRRLRGNFRCTDSSVGVEAQLSNLASITQVIDPKLHQHLETLGGGDYLFAFRMLMVLFRREFSFGDALYLWEMMWALEYDPDLFTLYEEEAGAGSEKAEGSKPKVKSIRQCGKFERENMRNASKTSVAPLPISIFLVASVLKEKSGKLLQEARGLDDVVKILNDITGNLDARKACSGAMKLHKKYLKKTGTPPDRTRSA